MLLRATYDYNIRLGCMFIQQALLISRLTFKLETLSVLAVEHLV